MRFTCRYLIILFIILILSSVCEAQINGFKRIKWAKERIAPGLIWKSTYTTTSDSLRQNINLLYVNLRKRDITLYYSPGKNARTSELATEAGAFAAVNAGFFDMKLGGSVTYIRVDGKIADQDTATKWKRVANMNGAILIDRYGNLFIDKIKPNSWFDLHPEFEDVLVTGCLLVKDGKIENMPGTSLVSNRHPRSVIGKKGRNRIILVTIDGRTPEAAGMTLRQAADLMLRLGCEDAVNLDGGGSTTMWIKGKPFSGVVNMPSDNRKFDHEGERAVSSIIVIREP